MPTVASGDTNAATIRTRVRTAGMLRQKIPLAA
jgi:hypothetical protein